MDRASWVAIDVSTNHRSQARSLALIHERVIGGADPPPALRDPIASSWRRCASAGVDPCHATAPLTLSTQEAAARWREHPLSIAEPLLRDLLADVRTDDRQVILACDADGSLLWIDGDPRTLEAAHEIHLQPGGLWSEMAAGTNAMGTALAAQHPIQVFSAEHFATPVHAWTCSAAPVRDPETGLQLGVIDLSGPFCTAHPHTLALMEAAAQMVEAELRHRIEERNARVRERWGGRLKGRLAATALASPAGTVIAANSDSWTQMRLRIPADGGVVALPGGATAVSEPLLSGEGFLLWRAHDRRSAIGEGALRIEALGRRRVRVDSGDGWIDLSHRHSEIVVLLSLMPDGLEAERLAYELYGRHGVAVTARAELSRLRRILGSRLPRGEHRLAGPLDADFLALDQLVQSGREAEALARYPGPLLPRSEVPLVIEARERLDLRLRESAVGSGDPALLERWLETSSGRDDIDACRVLVRCLAEGDRRRVAALSRLRRLARGEREERDETAR